MDWLRIDSGMPEHQKIAALAEHLDVDEDKALAIVTRLLCWTARVCESGDFAELTPRGLCYGARISVPNRSHSDVVSALIDAGWLENEGVGYRVHDWKEAQFAMIAARDRMRAFRASRVTHALRTGCATETVTDRPTDIHKEEKRTKAPDLVALWRERCPDLPQPRSLTGKRADTYRRRCLDPEWVASLPDVLTRMNASSFCRGDNDRGWTADVDFLLRPDTATRVLEGKYDDRKQNAPQGRTERHRAIGATGLAAMTTEELERESKAIRDTAYPNAVMGAASARLSALRAELGRRQTAAQETA